MSEIRVRFAPSPTGYLHMGGARTALFNWLFARHEEGSFVLRIEDTDVERSSEVYEEQLLDDLAWLGLDWDEGPRTGGEFGPYKQSECVERYRERAHGLVGEGKAYPCFCTDDELERKKQERLAKGQPPQYDGTCRDLSDAERDRRRQSGAPESVRFVFPESWELHLDDLIRRRVVFPPGMVGDFVIIRSNGLPTYNFAAAVDDHFMRITHVIRGEEHLSNTLRQLVLYEALGAPPPRFAHIPLIHGADHTKLSKRHGAPNIRDFRGQGYVAEAIVNYLALLGWSMPDGREIVSVDELVSAFSLDRVSRSPSIFDEVKMKWVCSQHIRHGGAERFFEEALPYFPEVLTHSYDRAVLREIFTVVSDNLCCFSQIGEEAKSFVRGAPELGDRQREMLRDSDDLLVALADALEALSGWNRESVSSAIRGVGKRAGVKGKGLYMPLRLALTGSGRGPDLSTIVAIRGREDVVRALRQASA